MKNFSKLSRYILKARSSWGYVIALLILVIIYCLTHQHYDPTREAADFWLSVEASVMASIIVMEGNRQYRRIIQKLNELERKLNETLNH